MSNDSYLRLIKAGAPELPREHFYRVRYQSNFMYERITVEIRKRRWADWLTMYLPWTKRVASYATLLPQDTIDENGLASVVYVCRRVVETSKLNDRAAVRARQIMSLEGDHP